MKTVCKLLGDLIKAGYGQGVMVLLAVIVGALLGGLGTLLVLTLG